MMITWIVASHDEDVLRENLLASFGPLRPDRSADPDLGRRGAELDIGLAQIEIVRAERTGDRVVIVRGAPSIAVAYNEGQRFALVGDVRVFVHHDVQLPGLLTVRSLLQQHCVAEIGLVGVIGSVSASCPWWLPREDIIGSVIDSRMGVIRGGREFGQAAILDGLLLASVHRLEWDTRYPGWHMYDHDQCMVQLAAARRNYVLPGGMGLVVHNNANSSDVSQLEGFESAARQFAEKWEGRLDGAS